MSQKRRNPPNAVTLDGDSLTIITVVKAARNFARVEIAPGAIERVKRGRASIERILKSGKVVYGINTGFGKLAETKVSPTQLDQLQLNLIRSHSVGTGEPLSEEEARAVLIVRLNSLLHGNSGVRVEVVKKIQEILNRRLHPFIPRYGSLGASGDLAPSAHIALCLVGEGMMIESNSQVVPTMDVFSKLKIKPIKLKAKEGLSIINGTQVMTGLGALIVDDVYSLIRNLDIAAAMSLEALGGSVGPFDSRVHKLRPLHGQAHVASRILRLLRESTLTEKSGRIQDPYSLRCIPQVHGAFYDALEYVRGVIEIELNSVTDNPIIFPDTDDVISAGNFHGQPIALALDFLCTAIAESSAYSERRIDKLLSGYNGKLPLFLSTDPGLNSGFMVAQYTAASLVAESKILSRAAGLENASVSAGQEDHSSMGVTSALKARSVVDFTLKVIAIEILCAAQALDYLTLGNTKKMGQGTRIAHQEVRKISEILKQDRPLYGDVDKVTKALADDRLSKAIERTVQL